VRKLLARLMIVSNAVPLPLAAASGKLGGHLVPIVSKDGAAMPSLRYTAAVLTLLGTTTLARAGLYYSGETIAELPSQWRGFLVDQRGLRGVAVKPPAGKPASPMRVEYQEAAAKLEKTTRSRKLTADEQADLGALYVRLGDMGKAIELLRAAQRMHATHFRIAANLGTAWQLQGDLEQASHCLEQAVRLAPGNLQKAEQLHLKLVRLRKNEAKDSQDLDNLFGVRYVNEKGVYEPGKLAADERKKLSASSVAQLQQVALWLPADGRLLWQLGELAGAHGDVKTSAAILEGCVSELGLNARELRRHRQTARAAADALGDASGHEDGHNLGMLKTRSRRPLLGRVNFAELPAISDTAVNALPWAVVTETTLDRKYKPTFPKYLKDLDGKQVALSGFMQPLDENNEVATFMLIEYPVGCWYCETPETTGIVYVEMPAGKTANLTRGLVKITGTLKLNATDPEDFLYTVSKAKLSEAE
jgi:tetratricopeptide (TPR) repeat protein